MSQERDGAAVSLHHIYSPWHVGEVDPICCWVISFPSATASVVPSALLQTYTWRLYRELSSQHYVWNVWKYAKLYFTMTHKRRNFHWMTSCDFGALTVHKDGRSHPDVTHRFANTPPEAERLVSLSAPSRVSSWFWNWKIPYLHVWVVPEVGNDWSMTAMSAPMPAHMLGYQHYLATKMSADPQLYGHSKNFKPVCEGMNSVELIATNHFWSLCNHFCWPLLAKPKMGLWHFCVGLLFEIRSSVHIYTQPLLWSYA